MYYYVVSQLKAAFISSSLTYPDSPDYGVTPSYNLHLEVISSNGYHMITSLLILYNLGMSLAAFIELPYLPHDDYWS